MEEKKEKTNTVLEVKNLNSAVSAKLKPSGKPEKEKKNGETRTR